MILHNGDHPIRVVQDTKGKVYVVQRLAGPPRSCIQDDMMISHPLEFFFPTDVRLLPLVFIVVRERGCLAMDLVDSWQMNLLQLSIDVTAMSSLSALEALGLMMSTIMVELLSRHAINELPTFVDWKSDAIVTQRWHNILDPRCFLLDSVQNVIGTLCVNLLCDQWGLARPLHSMSPIEGSHEIENRPPSAPSGRKKGKLSAEDFKGHQSLVSFFKKAPSTIASTSNDDQ